MRVLYITRTVQSCPIIETLSISLLLVETIYTLGPCTARWWHIYNHWHSDENHSAHQGIEKHILMGISFSEYFGAGVR